MNDNAKTWVQALRSGKYTQAQGRLKVAGSYCCLGVACELYRIETGEGDWYHDSFLDQPAVLPGRVRDWLGLHDIEGALGYGAKQTSLAERNDMGDSFDEIANLIEAREVELFV